MSHGSGEAEAVCEPNLTPLLDLVLQILMFFMVTVNFATEQNQEDIALPESQTARPMPTKGFKDPLFVNLRLDEKSRKPTIIVTGEADMNHADARRWLQKQFDDLARFAGDSKEVKNPVIIRADRNADYADVFQLLQSCSDAGFRNLKVRALIN